MSPHWGLIDYLFISRNIGVRLLVFVAGDVDCFVPLIYTYISFFLSSEANTIDRLERKKRDQERSRRVGRTVWQSYTLAMVEETETIHVCHRTPNAPTQKSCGRQSVRYRLLLDTRSATKRGIAFIIRVTLSVSPTRAGKHIDNSPDN